MIADGDFRHESILVSEKLVFNNQ